MTNCLLKVTLLTILASNGCAKKTTSEKKQDQAPNNNSEDIVSNSSSNLSLSFNIPRLTNASLSLADEEQDFFPQISSDSKVSIISECTETDENNTLANGKLTFRFVVNKSDSSKEMLAFTTAIVEESCSRLSLKLTGLVKGVSYDFFTNLSRAKIVYGNVMYGDTIYAGNVKGFQISQQAVKLDMEKISNPEEQAIDVIFKDENDPGSTDSTTQSFESFLTSFKTHYEKIFTALGSQDTQETLYVQGKNQGNTVLANISDPSKLLSIFKSTADSIIEKQESNSYKYSFLKGVYDIVTKEVDNTVTTNIQTSNQPSNQNSTETDAAFLSKFQAYYLNLLSQYSGATIENSLYNSGKSEASVVLSNIDNNSDRLTTLKNAGSSIASKNEDDNYKYSVLKGIYDQVTGQNTIENITESSNSNTPQVVISTYTALISYGESLISQLGSVDQSGFYSSGYSSGQSNINGATSAGNPEASIAQTAADSLGRVFESSFPKEYKYGYAKAFLDKLK